MAQGHLASHLIGIDTACSVCPTGHATEPESTKVTEKNADGKGGKIGGRGDITHLEGQVDKSRSRHISMSMLFKDSVSVHVRVDEYNAVM